MIGRAFWLIAAATLLVGLPAWLHYGQVIAMSNPTWLCLSW